MFIRTVVMYLVLLGAIRLMGKRQIGQLAPSEFVVTILIANLASVPLEDPAVPLVQGIKTIATVLLAEWSLSLLTLKSLRLRRLLCGKPVILVEEGRPLWENLRKNRITMDELTGHLRLQGVLEPGRVQYAVLETNGALSVLLYSDQEPASAREAGVKVEERLLPVTLVEDGQVLSRDLKRMGKDRPWLEKALRDRKLRLEEVLLLTLDRGGNITVIPKHPRR